MKKFLIIGLMLSFLLLSANFVKSAQVNNLNVQTTKQIQRSSVNTNTQTINEFHPGPPPPEVFLPATKAHYRTYIYAIYDSKGDVVGNIELKSDRYIFCDKLDNVTAVFIPTQNGYGVYNKDNVKTGYLIKTQKGFDEYDIYNSKIKTYIKKMTGYDVYNINNKLIQTIKEKRSKRTVIQYLN